MKRSLTISLQVLIILIGVGVLALMLWEPHLEGRNIHATAFEIYFKDPFLAYAYTTSIAFFVALYKAFKLLEYTRRNELLSQASMNALRTIKHCGLVLIASLVAAEMYLFISVRGKDDIAGGVAIGLLLILVSTVISSSAAVLERRLAGKRDPR